MLINKKVLLIILLVIFLIIPIKVSAHSGDKIKRVDLQANIKEDGRAQIVEKWYVNSFARYGYTKLMKNIEENDIQNYSVTDEEQNVYNLIDDFTLSGENGEFKNTYGILKNQNETYLFWGVNESGVHEYTLNYEIKNFVKKFERENVEKGINLDFIDNRYKSSNIFNYLFK